MCKGWRCSLSFNEFMWHIYAKHVWTPLSHWPTGGRNFTWGWVPTFVVCVGTDTKAIFCEGTRTEVRIQRNSTSYFILHEDGYPDRVLRGDTDANVEKSLRLFPWGWKRKYNFFCVDHLHASPRMPTQYFSVGICGAMHGAGLRGSVRQGCTGAQFFSFYWSALAYLK